MGALSLLLDTHTFYWWCIDSPALSATARAAIADSQNEKYVSAITAWEVITKFRSGKEPGFAGLAADVMGAVLAQGFSELPIVMRHAEVATNLPSHHKDPIDRFLIAQAIVEDMTIVTADGNFTGYTAKLLW
jgi:PIN domain nuclease of toxin-antitoxin system